MESKNSSIQTFGTRLPEFDYRKRLAAYALILDSAGAVAVVRENGPYFLPGGGSETNESPEETVSREVKEEMGCNIRIISKLGEVIQYFFADEQFYEMFATFFLVEITERNIGDAECEVLWLMPNEFEGKFFHACHEWFARYHNQ